MRSVDGMSNDKNYTDVPSNPPDTASGGAPEEPDETTDADGTPVENPSG
jgi:hypothetical protein